MIPRFAKMPGLGFQGANRANGNFYRSFHFINPERIRQRPFPPAGQKHRLNDDIFKKNNSVPSRRAAFSTPGIGERRCPGNIKIF